MTTATTGKGWHSTNAGRLTHGIYWVISNDRVISESSLMVHPYSILFKGSTDLGESAWDALPRQYMLEDPSDNFGNDFYSDDEGRARYAPNWTFGGSHTFGASNRQARETSSAIRRTLQRCLGNQKSERVFFTSPGHSTQNIGDRFLIEVKSAEVIDRQDLAINIDLPEISVSQKKSRPENGPVVGVDPSTFFNLETGVLRDVSISDFTSGLPAAVAEAEFERRKSLDPTLVYLGKFSTSSDRQSWVGLHITNIKREHVVNAEFF